MTALADADLIGVNSLSGRVCPDAGVDWLRCRRAISSLVRGFGWLRGRCPGVWSLWCRRIVDVPRFAVWLWLHGGLTSDAFVDWIGFRLVFSDLVRISGTPGRSGRWLIVVVQANPWDSAGSRPHPSWWLGAARCRRELIPIPPGVLRFGAGT